MSADLERWKQKYFDKLEEAEQQESSLKEVIHTMERLVVRISLAAQGLDSDLDNDLEKIRAHLRQESPDSKELGRALDGIERSVLAMDQNRESTAEGVLQALLQLIEQLQVCNLARAQKKALKSYGKQLQSRVRDLRHYPELLAEFARLQATALEHLVAAETGQEKQGFLSRLFASSAGESGKDQTDVNNLSKSGAGIEGNLESDESLVEEADIPPVDHPDSVQSIEEPFKLDVEPGVRPNFNSPEQFEPGFSAIADHVGATLTHLVDHLRLPETMNTEAGKVKQRIDLGLNWYELVPTLDDIANLVIAAFGRGQKEFEAFLKSLDDRLVSIQSYLETSQANQAASREHNSELQKVVCEHVSSMQETLQEAGDIETLKVSVTANLDSILSSLSSFVSKEADREVLQSREMMELQERLRTLENDSRDMQKQLAEEQQRAVTDILTGLPNRVAYEQRAQQEFERWRRYGNPLTMVVVDIDKFKNINDEYGHLAGDKVIQLIGKEIARRIRKTDFIARYGGEEFVILLPETDSKTAAGVMDKTREMVSRLPFHFRNERVEITVSMGVCEFAGQATLTGVFEMSDKALYRAKNNGRNRIEVSTFI